ncbi:hypothetical protein BGZ97_012613, partial [Linnemannia gamsii]
MAILTFFTPHATTAAPIANTDAKAKANTVAEAKVEAEAESAVTVAGVPALASLQQLEDDDCMEFTERLPSN